MVSSTRLMRKGHIKVDMPKPNISMIRTPIIKQYKIRYESKNIDQTDMFDKEIGLRAQNMLNSVLGSIGNMIGGTYMTT